MHSLIEGFILGLSIAAPVGPIGILCIRKTLNQGRRMGFVSGMGAATADAIYGSVAAFGLSFITSALVDHSVWLQWLGGAFLCYLAITTFRSKPTATAGTDSASSFGFVRTFATTFLLTLSNPMTVFSFIAVFSGMNAGGEGGSAVSLVAGVFLGSAAWWFVLCMAVGFFRRMMSPRLMQAINYSSGVILLGFGIFILLK
ncbi:LysE/ArgO family amino acid transporter [Cohnella faecalis]|uniref:LysE family translocator n=1 Tax=Cohnella faecalis TaxID=2315694 RepID=A0A398CMB2_9BACL|nr:LysE family translocator [Cohnella faecalis]RIE03390.1 LysE family translocator [Cohnella faecalis]